MRRVGLIGRGFVGEALHQTFSKVHHVEVFDTNPEKRTVESLEELIANTDSVVFVCLPTPMTRKGQCSLGIIIGVLDKLSQIAKGRIICLKSTMPPGSTKTLQNSFPDLRIMFNPEFLTEANYLNDFANQKTTILGSVKSGIDCHWQYADVPASEELEDVFKEALPETKIIHVDSNTAEMIKYMGNTFLAMKVSWANEMFEICKKSGVCYKEAIDIATLNDLRIGKAHTMVPGPDGKRGFGGSCLPKDLNAMIYYAREIGVWPSVLLGAWERNLDVRPEKDWEDLKGRAVTE